MHDQNLTTIQLKAISHFQTLGNTCEHAKTRCKHSATTHDQQLSPVRYADPLFYVADEYEVIGETQWQVIENSGDEQTINIHGFIYSKLRAILLHTVCILLCGLPYFALAYYPSYNRFKYIKCSLKAADYICGKFVHKTFFLKTDFGLLHRAGSGSNTDGH